MKNIHLLPTDKPSRLSIINSQLIFSKEYYVNPQNIYITSDEEIKEGDWVYSEQYKNILQFKLPSNEYFYKKIILTTDQDLIKDGVKPIPNEFLEWFVKNPSCKEVKIEYIKPDDARPSGYKIIIPKEEPKRHLIDMMKQDEYLGLYDVCENNILTCLKEKCECKHQKIMKQETLEEAAERLYPTDYGVKSKDIINIIKQDTFINGAKWQQERSYSEEEVENIVNKTVDKFCTFFSGDLKQKVAKEWFEQFKKK